MTDKPQTQPQPPEQKPEIVNRSVSMTAKEMERCTRRLARAMNRAQSEYEAEEVVVAVLYLLGDSMKKMGAIVNLNMSVREALPPFCAGYLAK
jgi:hypothetical protein